MTNESQPSPALLLAYLIPAAAYLLLIPQLPFPGDFALKASPILLLALTAWRTLTGSSQRWLTLALILSACGDISLSFSGETYFLAGLSCFLLAHLCYIITIRRHSRWQKRHWPIALLLIGLTSVMVALLIPKLGPLLLPVLIYILVILTMALTATGWQGQHRNLLLGGAIIFMLSDSMIAINRFVLPLSWAKHFIMLTYYLGQLLLAWALLADLSTSKQERDWEGVSN
ncbi:MAG: lysoplasmalogenase [Bacteroidota bacterium]